MKNKPIKTCTLNSISALEYYDFARRNWQFFPLAHHVVQALIERELAIKEKERRALTS